MHSLFVEQVRRIKALALCAGRAPELMGHVEREGVLRAAGQPPTPGYVDWVDARAAANDAIFANAQSELLARGEDWE